MAYRICTFDSAGRITSISDTSYSDTAEVIPQTSGFNPTLYSFVDESQLGSLISQQEPLDEFSAIVSTRSGDRVQIPQNRIGGYDPRAEVTLFIDNPYSNMNYGTNILQDLTKATVFYNSNLASGTKPYHSTAVKKFGPTSGRFTRSTIGFTGGGLYITNISKKNYLGYTAPHNLVGYGGLPSYSMEMFFYHLNATGNNFTLMQKGPAGQYANWKLSYDNSAGFLQFAWQSHGTTAGYNFSKNIVNTAGLVGNTWHHVAVSVVKNVAGSTSIGYLVSGYFNGTNVFTESVTSGSMPKYNEYGIYVGNNDTGTEGFNGYIDSLRVLESGVTTGIFGTGGYGFLPHGSGTLSVPTQLGFTRSSEVAFSMNFNGFDDTSSFFAESTDYIAGTTTRITNLALGSSGPTYGAQAEVGVRNVVRFTQGYTAGATGYSDATGFSTNYGTIVVPFINAATAGSSASFIHGYDMSYDLYGLYDNQPSLGVYRSNYRTEVKYSQGIELMMIIEGAYGNRGSSGSIFQTQFGQNPFRRLFSAASGNSYGVGLAHNSLYINPLDNTTMKYIMDNGYLATQGVCAASYSFTDARGISRNLTAADISNLRLDILDHQNKIRNTNLNAISQINAASTVNQIKQSAINKYPPTIFTLVGEEELPSKM